MQRGDNLQSINDQIIHLNTELADKVKRLKEAQDEIVRKGRMEQLGQLTATVAHELRNPLGAVRTSAFLMERKLKGKGMEVDAQIERINQVLSAVTTSSRSCWISRVRNTWIASPAIWIRGLPRHWRSLPSPVSLAWMARMCRLIRHAFSVRWSTCCPMPVRPWWGRVMIPQKLTRPDPAILVTTSMRDGGVVIAVRDNGPGIPPDVLARIREPVHHQELWHWAWCAGH